MFVSAVISFYQQPVRCWCGPERASDTTDEKGRADDDDGNKSPRCVGLERHTAHSNLLLNLSALWSIVIWKINAAGHSQIRNPISFLVIL